MRTLVDELKKRIGNNICNDVQLRTNIEDTLLDLHKRYNNWKEWRKDYRSRRSHGGN
jgi:hypothetical protein